MKRPRRVWRLLRRLGRRCVTCEGVVAAAGRRARHAATPAWAFQEYRDVAKEHRAGHPATRPEEPRVVGLTEDEYDRLCATGCVALHAVKPAPHYARAELVVAVAGRAPGRLARVTHCNHVSDLDLELYR